MAMLAEPRRRQKWGLNPRGTLWSDDQNKFGQKLMEKMGWNKGEGLGREGQGITEHIKAHHKDNTKGVGYKGKDDEWVKHVDAFENVLAALNSENNSADNSINNSANNSPNSSAINSPANSEDEDEETKSRKSLEKRSKDSRARVHYHKFTRGKDLSNYKEDDLACILGSKRSKRKDPIDNVEPKEEPIVKDVFGDEVGTTKKEHGVVTIAGGNYKEYFAIKMAALKKKREGIENNVKDEDKEESALRITEDASLETKKSKKKKKKDKDQLVAYENDSNVDQSEENCNSTIENIEKKRKKKKCKTEDSHSNMLVGPNIKEDDRPLFGFEFSCGFTNGTTVKKYPLNKHNIFSNEDYAGTCKDDENIKKNISPDELNKQISSENIKKKKHKKDLESFHENVEIKEKKKKKKSKDECYKIEDTTGISKDENSENGFEEVRKKKKKRCKNKNAEKISIVIENEKAAEFKQKVKVEKNESTEETILIDCIPENSELKKKKKKNKIKMEDESLIIEEVSSKTNDDENVNLKEKRKGKKRKREEEDDNDSSNSKKMKKITDDISQKVSPGKNELKRREYWKQRTDEIARHQLAMREKKRAKRIKKRSKKIKAHINPKEKNNLANKVLTAFEGAKVPNIISKRDKKKMEQSRVP